MARARFKALLIHQAIVSRATGSQAADGEIIDTWAGTGTIDCRFIHQAQRRADPSGGFPMVENHVLLCDTGSDVVEADRITTVTFKATGTSVDAGPFTIESVLNRNDDRQGHHMSLQLKRVE